MDKEYSGIPGIGEFTTASAKLALGEQNPLIKAGTVSLLRFFIY